MKIIKYISLLLVSVVLLNCEQIDVIESNIPFEEVYVVNGRLIAGSSNIEISFTKSFPIEEDLRIGDVALKDVTSYIWSETQGIFTLQHKKNGIYSPVSELLIENGTKYELFAEHNGERIYSVTTVPNEAEVVTAKLEGRHLKCEVIPNMKNVYAAKYFVESKFSGYENFEDSTFYEVTNKVSDTLNTIEVRTSDIPLEYFDNPEFYSVKMILYTFDDQYKDYYDTRKNNKPIENIFSEGGGSVYWNVAGEKTIGLFIGYSKTTFEIE